MAIIGLNDPTGTGSITDATTDVHKLLNGTGFTFTATAGIEVFKFGFQPGNGTTYASLQIGLYDVTSGADGAPLIASATVTAIAANTAVTSTISGVALTNGNIYAVGWRVISTGTMNRLFTTNACRQSSLTGSSALGGTWSDSSNLSQKYVVWAETQASTSGIAYKSSTSNSSCSSSLSSRG